MYDSASDDNLVTWQIVRSDLLNMKGIKSNGRSSAASVGAYIAIVRNVSSSLLHPSPLGLNCHYEIIRDQLRLRLMGNCVV